MLISCFTDTFGCIFWFFFLLKKGLNVARFTATFLFTYFFAFICETKFIQFKTSVYSCFADTFFDTMIQ